MIWDDHWWKHDEQTSNTHVWWPRSCWNFTWGCLLSWMWAYECAHACILFQVSCNFWSEEYDHVILSWSDFNSLHLDWSSTLIWIHFNSLDLRTAPLPAWQFDRLRVQISMTTRTFASDAPGARAPCRAGVMVYMTFRKEMYHNDALVVVNVFDCICIHVLICMYNTFTDTHCPFENMEVTQKHADSAWTWEIVLSFAIGLLRASVYHLCPVESGAFSRWVGRAWQGGWVARGCPSKVYSVW